jgi:hypothetical protein
MEVHKHVEYLRHLHYIPRFSSYLTESNVAIKTSRLKSFREIMSGTSENRLKRVSTAVWAKRMACECRSGDACS